MKKFIFTVPRQKSENLYKAVYKSANSKKLENNISTRFPLIPVTLHFQAHFQNITLQTQL